MSTHFCGFCTMLVYATNMLMAMIYRWRHAGKVCSGDYLDERYAFMEAPEPYAADAGFFLLLAICFYIVGIGISCAALSYGC